MQRYVAVVGPSAATPEECTSARTAARLLAADGVVVVCGGLGGVMGAAAEGCAEAGGTSLGLLPGPERAAGHPALTVTVPTGMGEMRNALVVRTADVVLAVGGSWGTASEVALAVRTGVPVVALGGWAWPGSPLLHEVRDVEDAVARVRELLAP
jgi:uncharacterized protein (TIGR00725 family)